MSQLKKGVMLSFVTIFLTNVIGLLVTPFMIRCLGDSQFGLYNLIGATVGTISLLDLGLNNTIVRFVSKYRAEKDENAQENFLGLTMLIYGLISALVVLLGIIFYFNLDLVFGNSLKPEELDQGKLMFIILIFNMGITLPGGAFTAICSGYEHFVFPKQLNIFRYVFRSITLIALLLLGGKALSIVILDTVLNLAVIFITAGYVFFKLRVKIRLTNLDKPFLKEIFAYSFWIFLGALILQFQWTIGQVVLGSYKGTSVVAVYALGIMLGSYYGAFSSAISGVLLPRATHLTVYNVDNRILVEEMTKIGRIMYIVLCFVFGGFLLVGKDFIRLWVGEKYLDAWLIVVMIMAAMTLPLAQSFALLILQAKNRMKFRTLISLFFNGLGLLLGILLIPYYGIVGMAAGTAIGITIAFVAINIYYYKVLELPIGLFFSSLFGRVTFGIFMVIAICCFFSVSAFETWVNMAINIMIFGLAYAGTLFFLINDYEKGLIKSLLKLRR